MLEIVILSIVTWLAYWGVINCGFVSDDIEGLQNYDGKLKKFDYGHLNKWLLYKLLDKSPRRNHLFSIFLHNVNVILLFAFLATILPAKLAFYSCLIFAIHPICIQSVGWISGRGYPISLFFCLLGFNIASSAPLASFPLSGDILNQGYLALLVIGYGFLYYLSVTAQFAALATFAIQLFLGNYFLGFIGFLISSFAGAGIIKEVINIRVKTFKEQNLGQSTIFRFTKIIVAIKTFAYYTRLCLFPKRLGLYHTFEYHYSEKTEKENKWFWLGFIMLLGFMAGLWFGNNVVRFAILWYLAYIFTFLNWITIHQFVSERYLYIASIGVYILIAYGLFTLDTFLFSGYPVILALACGLYLMRTWVHLPTYQDEVLFYQSNIWNFPDSEVAFANLGVVYMRCGLTNSAIDMWQISGKINSHYDVAWYNIHSVLKQKGDLNGSREFLKKAIDSPGCHFRDHWTGELQQLDHEINYVNELNQLSQQLVLIEKNPAKQQEVANIRKQLDEINSLHKKFEEFKKQNLVLIQQEEQQLKTKLVQLEKTKEEISKPLKMEDLIRARDNNFSFVKEAVNNMLKIETINAKT